LYLVIIILNKEEILDDLLSILVELGVTDVTIVESQSMGGVLAHRIPIFAGLRLQLGGEKIYSRTIFAITDDKGIDKKIDYMLNDCGIDLSKGVGRIVVIKIESILGEPHLPDLE
jgi:nitrogen regulatory protein P-II 1